MKQKAADSPQKHHQAQEQGRGRMKQDKANNPQKHHQIQEGWGARVVKIWGKFHRHDRRRQEGFQLESIVAWIRCLFKIIRTIVDVVHFLGS